MSTPTIMLNIGTGAWLNALEVESVRVSTDRRMVLVRTKQGEVHSITSTDALAYAAKLVEQINHAVLAIAGALPYTETKFKPSGT